MSDVHSGERFYPLGEALLRAPMSALELRVLLDILHRQAHGELIPSAQERAEKLGITRKTMGQAERQLEAYGHLMIQPMKGHENLYLASATALPMAHPKRLEFALAMAEYVSELTRVKITQVTEKAAEIGAKFAHPSNFYPGGGKFLPRGWEVFTQGVSKNYSGEPGSFPPDPPISPSNQSNFLAISHDTQSPVGVRAHEGTDPDPLAAPTPGRAVTDPEECETLALRIYREEFEPELWRYHCTDPSDRAQQGYRNALEGFLRRGIRPTRAHFAEAVTRACISWRELNRAYSPRDHGPVVSVLAALVNPMPPVEESNGRRNSDRGPGGHRPAGCGSGAAEREAEKQAKIARWSGAVERADAAGGPECGADGYREIN